MSTTEPLAMTAGQIEARLTEIAPPPDTGVTAAGLARYLAVCAELGFTRNITPFVRDDQLVPARTVCAEFAAAHALLALAEAYPDLADETARRIRDAWEDGNCLGAYLHADLTALRADPDEVARLDGAMLAAENAERAGEPSP